MAINDNVPYWGGDFTVAQPWGRPKVTPNPNPVPQFPPFSTTSGTTTVDPDDLVPDPCLETHVLGEITQYPDGVFGNCVECGERVKLPTVPGGYTVMQIRGFLERVIAGEDPEADGEFLAELGSLTAILEMEKDELDLALKRIEIAREILSARSDL